MLLKRLAIGLAAVLATILPAKAESALDTIIQRGTINVGVGLGTPPYGLMDSSMQPDGYDVSVAKLIARDLGVSHNLIPQRIGSKDELWQAAVDHGFGRLLASLASALDDIPADADDLARLQATVTRFIEANAAQPALLQVISREASTASCWVCAALFRCWATRASTASCSEASSGCWKISWGAASTVSLIENTP